MTRKKKKTTQSDMLYLKMWTHNQRQRTLDKIQDMVENQEVSNDIMLYFGRLLAYDNVAKVLK